jgi:hydrogenase small subunit
MYAQLIILKKERERKNTMKMTRRDFLKLAGASAAALGLTMYDLQNLEKVFANAGSPPVIWLQGSSCTGCTISLLNAVNPTIDDVLLNKISMKYHPNLSTAAGDLAIDTITSSSTIYQGQFVLVVEGGIPTGANGKYCVIGEKNGVDWTMLDALKELGPKAKRVVAVGACAAFHGIPGSGSNPTGIISVKDALTGLVSQPVINLPGCPAHPTVMVGVLIDTFNNTALTLDSYNRPTKYYGTDIIHQQCPRKGTGPVTDVGTYGCYTSLGCNGKGDSLNIDVCPSRKWNNGVNWCINVNHPCTGCASPEYPKTPLPVYYK